MKIYIYKRSVKDFVCNENTCHNYVFISYLLIHKGEKSEKMQSDEICNGKCNENWCLPRLY